jgi:DegV family protein with EDD domain
LVRGGRIGKARGLVGGLLQIKPILHLIDGEIHPYGQARTTRKARSRLISIVTEQKDHIVGAAVATTTELELGKEIAETLTNELNVEEVPIFRIGPVVGTHGGPGTVGVAFVLDL